MGSGVLRGKRVKSRKSVIGGRVVLWDSGVSIRAIRGGARSIVRG